MKGKICLITGATAGIGKCASVALAEKGAHIVIIARDRSKGERTQAEIAARSNGEPVDLMIGDLSSQGEIRQLVREFQARYQRLDVLINNAGVLSSERKETVDGIEMVFATNHLAYFLLANLLLPLLKASAPSRIVNVASDAHRYGHLDFDDIQSARSYSGWPAYARSKLANIVFTYALARRLEGSGVTVNCLHPGAVNTSLFQGFTGLLGIVTKIAAPFFRSPEKGAETIVYLASSPEVEGISGKYFKDCKAIGSSPESMDPKVAETLWRLSEQLTNPSGFPASQ